MSLTSSIIRYMGPFGLYALARKLCRNQPRILMYHRFSVQRCNGYTSQERFREQVAYIKRHFHPMTLGELAQSIFEEGRVPVHTVVITIDDGYRDFYDVAWPVLREYQVPATLFATTGFVNGDLWLWPDQVSWLLEQVERVPETIYCGDFVLRPGDMSTEARSRCWHALINFLLSVPDEQKHAHIRSFADRLDVQLPIEAPEQFRAMTWEQLKVVRDGGIEVGGHTVTHPSLGQVSNEEALSEIMGCRQALEKNLGDAPYSFCYPNGKRSDFTEDVKSIVEKSGFGAAVTAFSDSHGVMDRYAMRRHSGGDDPFQFMKSVSGLELLGRRLRGRAEQW